MSQPSVTDERSRWQSRGYIARLAITLLLASVLVGGVNGPGLLLMGQLDMARAGGSLWYPDWMYWQAAAMQIVLGILIAGGASFAAVMWMRRFSPGAVLRRLTVGPLVAGALWLTVSLMFGGAGMPSVLAMTSLAVGVFLIAGLAAGLTRLPLEPSSTADRI